MLKKSYTFLLLIAALLLAHHTVSKADVTPATLFKDHAVLQQGKAVPIWGRANPGEEVSVKFHGQTLTTTADKDGRWSVMLEQLTAFTKGENLVITGQNSVTIHDVVVGDVWLCSGQSNMSFPLRNAANATEATAAANSPLIRHIRVSRAVMSEPGDTVLTDGWRAATPQSVPNFSAVPYFFALEMQSTDDTPIGIINSSVGGTVIESWLSAPVLTKNPAYPAFMERWKKNQESVPEKRAQYDALLAKWQKDRDAAGADKQAEFLKQHPMPTEPAEIRATSEPSCLYNGMIHPLIPYALRGIIWYQGESNAIRAEEYYGYFTSLITSWRTDFAQGDLPFFWVQLPNFKASPNSNWTLMRESQARALSLPNTGMAVTIDLGDPNNIHPTNKNDVGKRLALVVRAKLMGSTEEWSGPQFTSCKQEGKAMRVQFAHATGGLVLRNSNATVPGVSFELAGADKKFCPATAKIDGDAVLVTSDSVPEPQAVRYAWSNAPEAVLYNGSGLPAAPFRSDNW